MSISTITKDVDEFLAEIEKADVDTVHWLDLEDRDTYRGPIESLRTFVVGVIEPLDDDGGPPVYECSIFRQYDQDTDEFIGYLYETRFVKAIIASVK